MNERNHNVLWRIEESVRNIEKRVTQPHIREPSKVSRNRVSELPPAVMTNRIGIGSYIDVRINHIDGCLHT